MTQIPRIDMTPYYAGRPGDRARIASEIDSACREIGFFTIVGHPIQQTALDDLFAVAREFYDLPDNEKFTYAPPKGTIMRGYVPIESQNLARSRGVEAPPDLRECFSIGRVDPMLNQPIAAHPAALFFEPNIWPRHPARFRTVNEAYYRRMESLARDLMRLFALGLGLQEDFFDPYIDDHFATLNMNHYPPLTRPTSDGQFRAGAHSDFGSLTILAQTAGAGGLEVLNKQGQWLRIPPQPEAFVINIGDLMARWTNDRWRSTVHRVSNPAVDRAATDRRQSITFFFHPNYDAAIECLPTCRLADDAPRYAPTKAGEYMRQRLLSVRNLAAKPFENRIRVD